MINHYWKIISNVRRVAGADQREFFRRAAAHYRRYRPSTADSAATGGPALDQVEADSTEQEASGLWRFWRYRLWPAFLRHRLWPLAAAVLLVRRIAVRTPPYRRRFRTKRRATQRALKRAVKLVYYGVQLCLPVDDELAVYSAYWARGYSGNPAAIHAKARELVPQVRAVWVAYQRYAGDVPAGITVVNPRSIAYYRSLARAKYFVNNVNFPTSWVKRKNTVFLQTQHGTPLKTMGLDLVDSPSGGRGMSFPKLMQRASTWDFNLSSNRYSTEVWRRAFPCNYEMLEYGYPRNDRLCTAGAADVAAARKRFGLKPSQTAVLYFPTFRDYRRGFDPMLDVARFLQALPPDHVLLLRAHYFNAGSTTLDELRGSRRLIDVSRHPTVEDLYLAGDVLMTDYSSAMFDYALLDRPIVIYAPDWEVYRATRGVYFDLLAEPPGVVATDEAQLAQAFTSGEVGGEQATKLRAAFRERFCPFDDGHAAERVVRRVFAPAVTSPPG
jgi:CDP-glycerol glycerophosphotransferase